MAQESVRNAVIGVFGEVICGSGHRRKVSDMTDSELGDFLAETLKSTQYINSQQRKRLEKTLQ
ncbi:hypothetical protein A2442_01975 [Candidatus Campbellbacteria bacterium RIFOXYC2_FULL_35_25]|uniref:Uncharacterized protein n=1 Tax=Candidatus Campbellbacteria bacterium RIFOXYC2_FULL_35_25 TaxID=1797582 RepID=A0A1F5EIV8_9BACT|nr:MAG: hypothetical protein A2442_01975 [Candidatus Campbellbacteria bacterium RIFOXYC2_FULL_35_25]